MLSYIKIGHTPATFFATLAIYHAETLRYLIIASVSETNA